MSCTHLCRYLFIIGGSCHKYHFCRDKSVFFARSTYLCLSRQNYRKIMFVATNIRRDKGFVATSILLSRQKLYLWQLPPMILLKVSSHQTRCDGDDSRLQLKDARDSSLVVIGRCLAVIGRRLAVIGRRLAAFRQYLIVIG